MNRERPRSGGYEDDPPADLSVWPLDGSEHVAESCEQGLIIRTLLSSLQELIETRGWSRVFAAADNYFAWVPGQPAKRVSPDVYLLDDPPERIPKMWRTWLPGNPAPRWALEIVSTDWLKDYEQDPVRYEELGCRELVVFDPDVALGRKCSPRRAGLMVFRRAEGGALERVYSGTGPVWSEQLEVWLVAVREGYSVRLRLSEDQAGTRLVPTAQESKVAMARALDLQKAAFDAASVALETERAARERAEQLAHDAQERLRELERQATPKPYPKTSRKKPSRR